MTPDHDDGHVVVHFVDVRELAVADDPAARAAACMPRNLRAALHSRDDVCPGHAGPHFPITTFSLIAPETLYESAANAFAAGQLDRRALGVKTGEGFADVQLDRTLKVCGCN